MAKVIGDTAAPEASDKATFKPYTAEETARLLTMCSEKRSWDEITRSFPGRTKDGLRSKHKMLKQPDLYKSFANPNSTDQEKRYQLLSTGKARAYVKALAAWELQRGGNSYAEVLELLADNLGQRRLNGLGRAYHDACKFSHNEQKCVEVLGRFVAAAVSKGANAEEEKERGQDEITVADPKEGDEEDTEVSPDAEQTETESYEDSDDDDEE